MQAILVITSTTNYKQLEVFCSQFYGQSVNVYIYNSTFSILKKRELEAQNIKFIPKVITEPSIEIALLKYALQNKQNTHFHLINEYSFVFPNFNVFNSFFVKNNSNYISIHNPLQWSITLEVAEYIIKHYNNEEYIINTIKDNDVFDIVGDNLRYTNGEVLSALQLKEYIVTGIMNKLIIHNIDCNQIGYEQIIKQVKYIYSRFNV